jgi:hypothetical protein
LVDTIGGGMTGPDVGLPQPLTLPDELGGTTGSAVDSTPDTFVGVSHDFGESTRSVLDAVANGLSTTAAVYGRAAALVVLLGFMAMRMSTAISATAAYATAGIGDSIRTGWLTSWGTVRCLSANASRAVSAPFLSASSASTSARTLGTVFQSSGRDVLGGLGDMQPRNPFRRDPSPPATGRRAGSTSSGRFLIALLLAAAGPLVAARELWRRRLLMRLTLFLAVLGASILIAVGTVLALVP